MNFFSNLALLLSIDSIFSVIFTCLYVVELSETAWLKNKTALYANVSEKSFDTVVVGILEHVN